MQGGVHGHGCAGGLLAKGLLPWSGEVWGVRVLWGGWQLLCRENVFRTCEGFLPVSPQLDHCLQEDFPIYKSFRFKGSIGPLRLHLVGAGAFAQLREALGSPIPMPRVLREERLLAVIQSTVIS